MNFFDFFVSLMFLSSARLLHLARLIAYVLIMQLRNYILRFEEMLSYWLLVCTF